MLNVDKKLILKIAEEYKPTLIYQVGSSIMCENPNDIDLLLIYRNNEDFKNFKRSIKYDGQIRYEIFANSLEGQEYNVIDYAYGANAYLNPLYGKLDEIDINKIDWLHNSELKVKVENRLLSRYCEHKFDNLDGSSYMQKPYRFLMTIYFIANNSYELSKEQIKILNKDKRVKYKERRDDIFSNRFTKEFIHITKEPVAI